MYLNVLRPYLNNSLKLVQVKEEISSLLKVKNGVTQGSVSGPFLFIVVINDSFYLCLAKPHS